MPKKSNAKKQKKTFSNLEQLFGSKTRFSLLKLFCAEQDKKYFMRELARLSNNQLNAVRREVANLERIGLIAEITGEDAKKRFYKLNTNFILANEIISLVSKSGLLAEKNLIGRMKNLGGVDLCILTGIFSNVQSPCDILVVGRINKEELARLIKEFELELQKSVAYAVFSPEEYKQRKSLTDKFLFSLLESKKMVAVDKYDEFTAQNDTPI